ncbi:MAG: translesion DNA synthesis-associated protein ImuA [Burkholderiales bacterium]|nr:translesion DNA synthesis-associated protein ImuA [Burkholderiales bacterium]
MASLIPTDVIRISSQTTSRALWRVNEMSPCRIPTMPSGFAKLDAELPGAGWPKSALIELLFLHSGVGELQILKPAIAAITRSQRVVLIQPPYVPNGAVIRNWGIRSDHVCWLKTHSTADALWSAEQILKNGSCGAIILWLNNVRIERLRRLNLAAQSADTCLWVMRPLSVQQELSPALLRLALRPALGGVNVNVIKRRGSIKDEAMYIPLPDMPARRYKLESEYAFLDQRASTTTAVRE